MSNRLTSGSYTFKTDARKTLSTPLVPSGSSSMPLRSALESATRSLAAAPILSLGASSRADRAGVTPGTSRFSSTRTSSYASTSDATSVRGSLLVTSTPSSYSSSRRYNALGSSRETCNNKTTNEDDFTTKSRRREECQLEDTVVSFSRHRQRENATAVNEEEKPKDRPTSTPNEVVRKPYSGWRSRLVNSDLSDEKVADDKSTVTRRRLDEPEATKVDSVHSDTVDNGDKRAENKKQTQRETTSTTCTISSSSVSMSGKSRNAESVASKVAIETSQKESGGESLEVSGGETKRVRERKVYRKERKPDYNGRPEVIPDIKITTTSIYDDLEYKEVDSGVHLDEPTSPASDRWSGHLTSPVKTQWTDEELDAFVRQLSNPQHQVTKIAGTPPGGDASTDSPRKCSLDLCHELKDRGRVRAPLARSETDSSVSFGELDVSERGVSGKGDEDGSKTGGGRGIISGLSGLRLIKNKKLARSSHAAKRYTAHKTKDDQTEPDAGPATSNQPLGSTVTFSCSSPEGSDGELAAEMRTTEQFSNGTSKDGGKKRRFRKMLSRPLNRSQSAGCAKDVPAHALFLENQQKKSKDVESLAARQSRASEGDIRRLDDEEDNEVEDDTAVTTAVRSKRISVSRIHKTKSADSAMLATDEFGGILPQSKTKSRNIAKKISRKMNFLRRRHTDSTLGLLKNDDGARRLASVDPEEAQEWSKSFETLLFDKTGLELFRGFLISEHSDENIEFWIACENYKNMKSSKHLPSVATKIFNDYVAVQSKKEINLDSKTRSLTFESVTSNPNRQTFDEAQKRVQALMEKDSYRRFLESEIYQDLASGNIQQKS